MLYAMHLFIPNIHESTLSQYYIHASEEEIK